MSKWIYESLPSLERLDSMSNNERITMSETNETRSGETLESVVQPQQDSGVAFNPDVQPVAIEWAICDAVRAEAMRAADRAFAIPWWRVRQWRDGMERAKALNDAWRIVLDQILKHR